MADYDAPTYGERIADAYDRLPWLPGTTEAAVEFLAGVAGKGPVLELGIGTGRIALPLATRGLEIHGIDASPAMVAKLRAKPGGDRIPVVIGDFADLALGRRFSLIFVVFNTFFGLPSQEAQVRCFARVADHLAEDGVFALEAFVPDPTLFDRGQRVAARALTADTAYLDVSIHDPVEQRARSLLLAITEDGIRTYPVQVRYAWPSELDLMARLAGLRLRERWGGWRREPFTAQSAAHVSVYARG